MKKFFEEFKQFIARGNVLDLAVAVIIGGAFSKIINSLVKDVLMPVISIFVGSEGFENFKYVITPANTDLNIQENAIMYGLFIQNIIDFLIIAFVIFVIIRVFSRVHERLNAKKLEEERLQKEEEEKKKKAQEELDKDKPTVESLLIDIKELLEKRN
jgi:large conductance mechanosensitive channel